jgi:hypothetical protein
MRHLGALGFLLFWVLAASGLYLYLRLDTSASGAYASISELEWWFGGVLRSVHRYAADAFVVVTVLHLVREMWLGRWRGFRAFTWLSGVPLLWLLYASGLVGYWLVWDARSQFAFLATLEWLGLAAGAGAAPDRLFSLFVFLHIGLPLALLPACGFMCCASVGRGPGRRAVSLWHSSPCCWDLPCCARRCPSLPGTRRSRRAAWRWTGSTSSSIR